jgi:peptide/nickel transport system permease protein
VKEWVPGHRIVFERNEAFWGQYPWYTKPQGRVMEIIRVPDGAARFAMLKSGQADVILPTDLAIAKNLPRQPGKGTMSFYGLDKPVWQQYLNFVIGVLVGNFGVSLRWADQAAFDVVMQRLPATLQLSGTAFIFSVVLGVGIGVLAATRPDTMVDRMGQVLAVAGQSMPVFWTAILLILFFSVYLGWLPSAGGVSRSGLKALILPTVALGWFFVAAHMRVVRSSMLEVLDSEYIKLLRGKGMPRHVVIWKHAFKNAAVPVFTLAGP